MKLIYVAGPISRGDISDNVARAHAAGIALLKAGFSVIVPHGSVFWGNYIVDGDSFVPEASPAGTTHEQWIACDLEIVRRCDAVLRLPGESKGADMEVREATRLGIPVYCGVATLLAHMTP